MKIDEAYAAITDKIVAELEKGNRPWNAPWNAAHKAGKISRPLRFNLEPYSGINVLILWCIADLADYTAPIWMTFRQAKKLGGHVRKGERSSPVVFAKQTVVSEFDTETGQEEEMIIPIYRAYSVFNVEQIEGLPGDYYELAMPRLEPAERISRAEAFFAATGAEIRTGGNQAYYQLNADFVQMPPFEAFKDAEAYYCTLAHELVHWTRHGSRLDRDFGRKKWGDEGYAREELVAELGAAFLAAELGLSLTPREDHAPYIKHWLGVLKGDKRAIFQAAAAAQRAVEFLQGLQTETLFSAEVAA